MKVSRKLAAVLALLFMVVVGLAYAQTTTKTAPKKPAVTKKVQQQMCPCPMCQMCPQHKQMMQRMQGQGPGMPMCAMMGEMPGKMGEMPGMMGGTPGKMGEMPGKMGGMPGMMGGTPGMMGMGMMQPPTMLVDGKSIYILRGNELIKLNRDTLELEKSTMLPAPAGPHPGHQMAPPPPPAQ